MALSARRLHPHFVAAIAGLDRRVIPEDRGETRFTGLRAACDALPERAIQRLEGLTAEHSLAGFPRHYRLRRFFRCRKFASRIVAATIGPDSPRIETQDLVSGRSRHEEARDGGAGRPHPVQRAHGPRDAAGIRLPAPLDRGRSELWDNRRAIRRAREYHPAKVRELHRTTVMEATPPMAELTRSVA